ncbi:hypothetical protein PANDA_020764 [Ailuropoda melanoleuca]|uniref:C2H2-type domain-containing protein n=1 Tax=Ailuropoda melanoleuca TaxID=9646 RepID=D2I536_AILME|nr:hypothetical protein PANDA_020764 [Ailuropoda melanoleuca]
MAAAAPTEPAQVNARLPHSPLSPHADPKGPRRGACSRPCGPGPGVRDREAPAGGGPCVSAGVLAAGAGSGLRGRLGQRLEGVCASSGEQHVSLPSVWSKTLYSRFPLSIVQGPISFVLSPDPAKIRGCCCGAEGEEAPFAQGTSVGASQAGTPTAAVSSRKTHPCEMCGPVLRDIFHLAEHQGKGNSQKLLRCGACGKRFYFSAKSQPQQEQHLGAKPCRSRVDGASLVKSWGFHGSGKPFTCGEIQKDFLSGSGHVQPEATHTGEKPHMITQCRTTLQSRKSHHPWGGCKKAFGPKHTDSQDQGVHFGRQSFVCSECGKTFREFTLDKSLINAMNVGNLLLAVLPYVIIKQFTLE